MFILLVLLVLALYVGYKYTMFREFSEEEANKVFKALGYDDFGVGNLTSSLIQQLIVKTYPPSVFCSEVSLPNRVAWENAARNKGRSVDAIVTEVYGLRFRGKILHEILKHNSGKIDGFRLLYTPFFNILFKKS